MTTNRITAFTLLAICLISSVCFAQENISLTNHVVPQPEPPKSNEKLHLFLLAIPDSALQNLQLPSKLRQEEEDGPTAAPSFTQTGQYLGQIIQGVLGGDFRPIFAGTVGFVEEPMAAANLGSFFGTIAPGLNLAFREIYTRAQTALGLRAKTTPQPEAAQEAPAAPTPPPAHELTIEEIIAGSSNASEIKPSDYVVVQETGKGVNRTITVYFGNDLSNQQGLIEEKQQFQQHQSQVELLSESEQKLVPSSTTSWQYVLNQVNSESSTVPPLPLWRPRTTASPAASGEDGDYDGRLL